MNLIVAVDNNYAIGNKGNLIYNIPMDLKHFKEHTLNKIVVMGERTYLSLPKHPLPKRVNIVLCDRDVEYEGAIVVHNTHELRDKLATYNTNDVYVIGGASVYNLLMDNCKYAYITHIDASDDADTFINNIELRPNWKLSAQSETLTENGLQFKFCTYENVNVMPM